MKTFRRGFTLIEVALFLAVTGALFVGVTVGVQNSIFQQRYNDAVQNFAEFLRGVYAETMNVQNQVPGGMTEKAIYGKLVTFGETTDLAGCPVNGGTGTMGANCTNDRNKNSVFVYDVIGDIGEVETGNIIESLNLLSMNVVEVDTSNNRLQPVGIVEDYSPKWGAQIENTGGYDIFKGAVLIVRHPSSGTVYTYTLKGETLDINAAVAEPVAPGRLEERKAAISALLRGKLSSFSQDQDVDFCINPNAGEQYRQRRDVRIEKFSRNSSGISVIASDTEENKCIVE